MSDYLDLNELRITIGNNLTNSTNYQYYSYDMGELRSALKLHGGLRISHLTDFMTDEFNKTLMKLHSIINDSEKIEMCQFNELHPQSTKLIYVILSDMFNADALDSTFMIKSIWENKNHLLSNTVSGLHLIDKLKGFSNELIKDFVGYLKDLSRMLANTTIHDIKINELGFIPNLIDNKPIINMIDLDTVNQVNKNTESDLEEIIANEVNLVLKLMQDLYASGDGIIRITSIDNSVHMIEFITSFHHNIHKTICKFDEMRAYIILTTIKTILRHS